MSESDTLAGLNVLVTRPAGQAGSLIDTITARGGVAIPFPLLIIEPVTDEARCATIRQAILDLDNYHILIFISTNAARFGLDWVDRYWPQFPVGIEVVAVGPSTAAALASLPCEVQTAANGMQSEDILQLPVLTRVEDKKIALFRGVGGRELLADTLRERGARVDYIETYERRDPMVTGDQLLAMMRDKGVNVISVTSARMLAVLCRLIEIKQSDVSLLPLLVPSERIREEALAAGFVSVFNTHGATDEAIVAALAGIASPHRNSSNGTHSDRYRD